ncbi:MAG: rRNA maturation RNase YbeY [Gemmatimonadaceae bacterium]
MSVAVDVARDGVRVPLAAERVREIVRAVCKKEKVPEALISVTFVTDRKSAKMNRDFLGHSGATDVITFELAPTVGAVVGDIYIAVDVARENARMHRVGVREELVRLVVHGTLHVLGHSHAEDEERTTGDMWRKQERLVAVLA